MYGARMAMVPKGKPLDPRRRAFLASLPRKLRNELERALTLDGDSARMASAESTAEQAAKQLVPLVMPR